MAAPGRSRRFARIIGTSGSPRGDIALAAAVSAFAGLLWWQSLAIPPPFFDPLGSAAVPRAIALILAVLSVLVLARALLALPWPATARDQGFRPRPDIALGLVLLVVAYIALMQAEVLSFRTATIGFLIAAKSVLRFDTASRDTRAGEYVIIGTLASFGWALVAAYATLALMAALPPIGFPSVSP